MSKLDGKWADFYLQYMCFYHIKPGEAVYVLKLHSPKNRHFCVFRYTSNETICYVSVLLLFIYKSRKNSLKEP